MKTSITGTGAGTKNNSSKSRPMANKKTGVRNMDNMPATEKVRGKHSHGHSMNNEGTNVDYEEQR